MADNKRSSSSEADRTLMIQLDGSYFSALQAAAEHQGKNASDLGAELIKKWLNNSLFRPNR